MLLELAVAVLDVAVVGEGRPAPADRLADALERQGRREEAIQALVARTRRYAAYQRKWMRRIPGLLPVDGDRPTAEVAGEIVAQLGSVAPAP